MYSLSGKNENLFQDSFGGNEDSYIKVKEVEQYKDASRFAISYLDNGIFKIKVINIDKSNDKIETCVNAELNSELGINNRTEPNDENDDPFITCTFVTKDILFVNLFHN